MIALVAMTWPTAIVYVAVIICLFGIPVAVSARRNPGEQSAVLQEVRAVREELAALRTEVAELDRVLKSVE